MKRHKQHRQLGRRFLAGLCTLAMLTSSLGPGISAAAAGKGKSRKQMEKDMEASIKKALEKEDPSIKKDHPKGIFSFATLQGEVEEDNKDPLAVYLVRHGGTEGEQKVKIKFSDYSAEYGKDYYAKLDDSIFAGKVEANPDSVPLFYMFDESGEGDGEQKAIDEESIIEAYGEERGKKIIALTKEYSEAEAKATAEKENGKETEDEATTEKENGEETEAKATTEKENGEETEAKATAEKENGEETEAKATAEKENGKETEAKTSDSKAADAGKKQEDASSPLDQLIDETSQYTDSGYSLTMDELLKDDKRNEDTATYGKNMLDTIFPGAETELVFADGEYMKKIYVYPIDNKVSDGSRVFNVQINGGSKDLAWQEGENSATVTIADDEQDEQAKISIKEYSKSVGTNGKASVTLQRKDGLYKVSTVEFSVTAAKKEVAKGTAIFMPNMKEKKIEFSVSDVDAKTVDSIDFTLKKPVGAELSGAKSRAISMTDLKIKKHATANSNDKSDDESPVGMAGKLAVNGIDLDLRSFVKDEDKGCDSTKYSAEKSKLHIEIPKSEAAGCKDARVMGTLKKKINQETIESIDIDFERSDGSTACNRMYVAKTNKSTGAKYDNWDGSRDKVLAMKGDHDATMSVSFWNGLLKNAHNTIDYDNNDMKYKEGDTNIYTPLTLGVKKTSGGVNGMVLDVYGVRLNFYNYSINIQPADELEGHADKPGEMLFEVTATPGQNTTSEVSHSTRYAYEQVNFNAHPADYAYLDHLQFGDGTVIDAKYCEIDGGTATLDMNDAFFDQYQEQIDSTHKSFDIKPVYAKKSVKLSISADEHGGIEVEGKKYSRGTKNKEITIHVGDKLKVKPYDVEKDYYFYSYEMISTGLNGQGDIAKHGYYAEQPDNIDILNYNYTIKPNYTFDGTSVVITADNIPEGCGIDKKEWTYKEDKIHSRQILDIHARTAEGYRAKWTIASNTHEWYGKTFYGDTLYHKVGGPTDEITLEFEKCPDMQYVRVNGKALIQDATIKSPPVLNNKGVYLGDYVPVANANVQMGEFSALTKQDGSYSIYSHTESEETSDGAKKSNGVKTLAKDTGLKKAEDPHVDHSQATPIHAIPKGSLENSMSLGESKKHTYYYLAENVNIGQIGITGHVTLCLNGHRLKANDSGRTLIYLDDMSRLDICDCKGGGEIINWEAPAIRGSMYSSGGNVLNIYGGYISTEYTAPQDSDKATIIVDHVNMYGGEVEVYSTTKKLGPIKLNTIGGAIYTEPGGTVNISGGEVSSGSGEYAGIFALGSGEEYGNPIVNISGGKVSSDEGVAIKNYNKGIINVRGGKVSSSDNYGIYNNAGTVNVSGGEIEASQKHGIYNEGELNLKGGTVRSAAGTAIYGYGSKLGISGDYTHLYSGTPYDIYAGVHIDGKLQKGESPYRIYVGKSDLNSPITKGWGDYMKGMRISDYFVSSDSAYTLVSRDNELVPMDADTAPTEAPASAPVLDTPNGANVTTYLKAGPNETRTVKVIHNGLEEVYYLDITGDLKGVHSSESNPYTMFDNPNKWPKLELSFFGEGPIPSKVNTLLGTVDEDDYPTRLETSAKIEMRNYSVGFELELADVVDSEGEDLIDKVNFYIYNKDNILKSVHTVERTEKGQTTYVLDRYQIQDEEGRVGYMKLNGLLDFADKDKIYVELVGTMKDPSGNKTEDADMSYGLYDTGIRFQEKLDVVEVQLKDVEPSANGVPTVDVLGQMLPTLKIGKLGVSAVITSNTMEFSVGFDVKKLNKSIYDSWAAEKVNKINDLYEQIEDETYRKDATQKDLDDLQKQYEADEAELAQLSQNKNPTDEEIKRKNQLHQEMDGLQRDMTTLKDEIEEFNNSIDEKQDQYDELTASPEATKDPLKPAVANDEKALNVTEEVTPEEITNVGEVTGPELNPLDKNKTWAKMKKNLKDEADKSGITKPKADSLQGHGTISANLGVDIGVTVRLKMLVLNTGNAEWCFDTALVYFKVSGGVSAMYYFVIPNFPIPMYAGANFTASAGLYAGMGATQNVTMNEMGEEDYTGDTLYFTGDIPVTLGIEGFVGMGLKSLLAIELGIGFLQKFDFAYTSNGGQKGTGMSSFYGYVQTNVLFFSYKWKFAQANWKYTMYETTEGAITNLKQMMKDSDLGSDAALSDFTAEAAPKVHYYGGAQPMTQTGTAQQKRRKLKKAGVSYSANDSKVLAEGLTRTVSDIVPLGDGKYLLAFEGVRREADWPEGIKPDQTDNTFNSRAIYLSYFDGKVWTEPTVLQKDATMDTGLQVEEMGDEILISWSSADHRFTKDEIPTEEMKEGGQTVKADDAVLKVLSSLDVYAAVLKKSEVQSFVNASAGNKLAKIDRLTKDQDLTDAQRKTVEENLAEGAEYLGYGHENGQAVSVGDQIYLFYNTIDYNHWKNGKKSENLSDIVDAKGYILYKIYDKKSGKWLEGYADSRDKETYEKLGFTMGQRMADVHLSVSDSEEKILPMVSQMDAQTVKVKGEDRVALTYLVDSDGDSSTTMDDQLLFIAFMKPAQVKDGAVTAEAEWSNPLEMSTKYSHVTDPQMVETRNNGKDTVYLVWADDEKLLYTNLTQLFQEIKADKEVDGSEDAFTPYTPVEVTQTELQNGKKIDVYTMQAGMEPKIAILGDDENGFQYNNGYRLAADDKGHIYAVWAQSSGSEQGLYLSAMSPAEQGAGSEAWSKPRALDWNEAGGKYLTDPSIAVDSDGTILIGHNAYNLKNITGSKDGKRYLDRREHADDTFCVTVEKAVGTPVLEEAELSNDYPRAGEKFTVTASVGNDGFLAAEKINVKAEFVQKKGQTEKVLDTQTQSFENVRSGHRDEARLSFTMKQEYLDAAKDDQATYYIRMTASEKKAGADGDYAQTASASVDVKTGAHYVFTNEHVDGYRCHDITRDKEAGTLNFGKETGENRYVYSVTVVNDGNLPAEDMKAAMFVSNENAFASTRHKNGTYEGTDRELEEYFKTHSATESVVNNEDFDNWIGVRSILAEQTTGLDVGKSAKLNVLSAKIPDSMYSKLGGMDLMLAVYDQAAAGNAATKNEGISTQPVSIVEEENVRLSLRAEDKKAGDQTVANGSTMSLNALVLPLKAAPYYNVQWESSNPKVATVDNGDVTAVGGGTTTIKASLMKDGKEVMNRSVDITVKGASAVTPSASPKPAAKVQVKVAFQGNKGKVKGSAQKTVTVGETYGKLPKAERKGYSFKGWYTKKSGGTKVKESTKVTNKSAHTLYAQWKKVSVGKAQIKKLTAKKNGKLKITMVPVKSADGYQICYAPKKKFPKKKTRRLNIKKTAATIKKLKKGKTYYVKARAYKLDSTGKKVYGKYGKAKKKK